MLIRRENMSNLTFISDELNGKKLCERFLVPGHVVLVSEETDSEDRKKN